MTKKNTRKSADSRKKKSESIKKEVDPAKATGKVVLTQRATEGVFIFLLALAAFVSLCLFSYKGGAQDWAQVTLLTNAGGRVGAYLSGLLFYVFGYVAYLCPVLIVYLAITLLSGKELGKFNGLVMSLRFAGAILTLASLCGLFSLLGIHLSQHLPQSGGGVIGLVMTYYLYNLFEIAGSAIILAGLTLLGLTLMTHVSWLSAAEVVGRFFLHGVSTVIKAAKWLASGVQQLFAKTITLIKRSKDLLPANDQQTQLHQYKVKKVKKASKPNVEVEAEEEAFFGSPPEKNVKVKVSDRYHKERQQPLFKPKGNDALPPLTLLSIPEKSASSNRVSHKELEARSREVEQRLLDFGVDVNVVAVHPGPVITRFELQLAPGLKVSKITALGKDLARSLSVTSVRVVEVIAGKSVVGLELPNEHREMVCLSEVLATEAYDKAKSPLSLALGVDIAGAPVIVDLAKMPHLLVAGTTGSGKSVGVNAMLLSLLLRSTPDEVRLILVDPKMLELSVYEGIPHLLTPVVTDMKDAASALRWSVMEMERRYRLMAALGVRNISGFNKKVKEAIKKDKPIKDPLWQGLEEENAPTLTSLPSIVVVIDELADMMMVVGKKVEQLIARIAQKARAAGIHLILATQRPSVDVLTGLIKSNIPTRISFQVSSKIDSRTILDQGGADQLLGHGDMLYLAPGLGTPARVHGAFVDDNEVHRVANAWRELGEPDYIESVTAATGEVDEMGMLSSEEDQEDSDPLYDEAVAFITQTRKASTSSVQRRFKIGYNRAARLVEEMERTGVVSPLEGGSREVLAPPPPQTGDA